MYCKDSFYIFVGILINAKKKQNGFTLFGKAVLTQQRPKTNDDE